MNVIKVEIKDKKAYRTDDSAYVCDNSDFTVVFSFDEEWNDFETKTARFSYDDKYQDVVFTGTECPMPIISNTKLISVGVFAGDLHTTTPASIVANKSILCGYGVPEEPAPNVYAQIVELCEETKEITQSIRDDMNLVKGDSSGSVQQINGGVTNGDGEVVDDSVALGKSSTALGARNVAKGDASLVAGYKNKAYMQGSVAFGGGSTAGDPDKQEIFDAMIALAQSEADLYENYDTYKSQYDALHPDSPAPDLATLQNYKNGFAFAAGEGNQALGRGSTVFGISNISYGQHNLVAGVDNKPSGNCQFVAGQHSADDPSKLFIIGAGTSTDDRKNVFSIDKDGNIDNPVIAQILDILSSPEIKEDNVIYAFDNELKTNRFVSHINHGTYVVENQHLRINAKGQDPYIVQSFASQPLDGEEHKYIKIKYRIKSGELFEGGSKIHFTTTTSEGFSDVNSVDFSVVADGNWHTVVIDMSTNENWASSVQYVRIDIPNHAYSNPTIWLDYVGYFTNQEHAQEY